MSLWSDNCRLIQRAGDRPFVVGRVQSKSVNAGGLAKPDVTGSRSLLLPFAFFSVGFVGRAGRCQGRAVFARRSEPLTGGSSVLCQRPFFSLRRRHSGRWESGNPGFGFPLFHGPQFFFVFGLSSLIAYKQQQTTAVDTASVLHRIYLESVGMNTL